MKKQTIYLGFFGLISVLLFADLCFVSAETEVSRSKENPDKMRLIMEQNVLEKEGRKLEKAGDYDAAIKKYEQAAEYSDKIWGDPRGYAMASIVEVLQNEGKYAEALKKLKYVRGAHPKHEYYIDWEKELTALVEYKKTGNPKPVYEFIDRYQEKYKDRMPPKSYWSSTYIETLLRLYDTIGDYGKGIAYIDLCMSFFKQQDIKKYGQYKPGHADEEYLKVREAFEQDKKNGTKGSATKALIQSDYFAW